MSNSLCVRQEARLVAYLDGEMCLEDAVELEQSLSTDPALAAALRSLVLADQLLRRLGRRSGRSAAVSATTLLLLLRMLPPMQRACSYRATTGVAAVAGPP